MFKIIKECMGNVRTFLLACIIASNIHVYVQNKRKVTSIVVPRRPCSSKRRILAI